MYKAYGIHKVYEWYTKGCDAVITEDGLATDISNLIVTLKEKENLTTLSNIINNEIKI